MVCYQRIAALLTMEICSDRKQSLEQEMLDSGLQVLVGMAPRYGPPRSRTWFENDGNDDRIIDKESQSMELITSVR